MRVVVLTSSTDGTAAYAVPLLVKEGTIKVEMVILNEGTISNKKKHYRVKLKKLLKLGLLGALNGIRMRKWFNQDAAKYLQVTDLETTCKNNNIRFERTPSINCDNTRKLFKEANAELGLSLGNSFISKSVFSICPLGMLNIHGEILPDYQNAQSIIWQLYNGSSETGYTIHKINSKIDQGDIVYQETIPIVFRDTLKDTVAYNCAQITKFACMGLVKVVKTFNDYNGNARPQGTGNHYTTPSWKQFSKIKNQFTRLKSNAGKNTLA